MPDPKPRLLVLTSTFPRWRDDVEPPFVFELSRRLTDAFDITVLTPRAPGSLECETLDGLHVIRFPYFIRRWENLATHGGGILNRLRANPLNYLLVPPFLIGQTWALIRVLRRSHWDLIHAHWLIPQGIVALIARRLARHPVPSVCTSHGGDLFALRGRLFRAMKRAVLRASARISVVSAAMRDEVLALGIDAEKVEVIPMGVDLHKRFTPDPRVAREANALLFVGRLVEKKGVDLLLQALPQVLQAYPDTHLTIAGGGPLEPELRLLADASGIGDHVDFRGMVAQSDLPDLYRRATLFVAPFRVAGSGDQEGFPLVPLEAIGCGCPLVCGEIVAFGEVIRHDREAILIPPDDHAALAKAVIALLGDPARRDRLAADARARCRESFDWDSIAIRYAGLLKNALPPSDVKPT
ncbi:glycosyltransferase family 4 protein [Thiocapsa marina]|uniref:Glycosyl transferase group 1 n=1 Tax=Thiocapsa marina 5811 TaxID=768671 RepID=F9UEX0_9GAMM|nr:glycosyltransferase family 4 protein [Thiocapsa marina]EGV17441.1 glycosyl transferase group 1 [Thiocapsa marina 5811]